MRPGPAPQCDATQIARTTIDGIDAATYSAPIPISYTIVESADRAYTRTGLGAAELSDWTAVKLG